MLSQLGSASGPEAVATLAEEALTLSSREENPQVWATLQGLLGSSLAESVQGRYTSDLFARVLSAYEAALTVYTPEQTPDSWRLTQRNVGATHLGAVFSGLADPKGHVEAAIVAYTNALEPPCREDEVSLWLQCQGELAGAFEMAALWRGPEAWLQSARAYEAMLSRVDREASPEIWAELNLKLASSLSESGLGDFKEVRESDPFDLAGQAKEQAEALEANFQGEDSREEDDPDWHVPFLLNEEASLLQYHMKQFLETGSVASRTPKARSSLERQRWKFFLTLLEHLQEKYSTAGRIQRLFLDVEEGKTGFILFLRGFGSRPQYFKAVTVTYAAGEDLAEKRERDRLVRELAPVPLVFIANPVDSGPLELAMADLSQESLGFRVESGATWEMDVRALISAASFIVVHNPKITPGLTAEIAMIEQLGRREHTFFASPELAAEVLNTREGDFLTLTEQAIEHMRVSTRGRALAPGALPPSTCRWIGGLRLHRLEHEVQALGRWAESLARVRERQPVATDLALDACNYLLACLCLLEEIDRLPPVLLALSQILESMDDELLPEARSLAEGYSSLASELRAAWEQTSPGLTRIERTVEAFRQLETG